MMWLAGLALKLGVPEKFAKVVGVGMAIIAVVALLAIGWAVVKHNIIANHEAQQEAADTKADRAADENAGRQRREDDARQSNEARELERVRENGKAQSDVDRRLARQRCIRLQQSARTAGREPPRCG